MNEKIWFYGNGEYKVFTSKIQIMRKFDEMGLQKSCEYFYKDRKFGEDFIFPSELKDKIKDIIK